MNMKKQNISSPSSLNIRAGPQSPASNNGKKPAEKDAEPTVKRSERIMKKRLSTPKPPIVEKQNTNKRKQASETRSTSKKKLRTPMMIPKKEQGKYCWLCHKPGHNRLCACNRTYHDQCLQNEGKIFENDKCPECLLKSILGAERIRPFNKELKVFLVAAVKRVKEKYKKKMLTWSTYAYGKQGFEIKDVLNKIPDYKTTVEFFLDLKWCYHKFSTQYNASSRLLKDMENFIKDIKEELYDMEACPDCYFHMYIKEETETSFVRLCDPPHDIVWAKVNGHSHWPAKLLSIVGEKARVRFFGKHEKSDVYIKNVFHISKDHPKYKQRNITGMQNSLEYTYATQELLDYRELYEKHVGRFNFFNFRTFYKENTQQDEQGPGPDTSGNISTQSPLFEPTASASTILQPGTSSILYPETSSVLHPGTSSILHLGTSSILHQGTSSILHPGISSMLHPGKSPILHPGTSSILHPGPSILHPRLSSILHSGPSSMLHPGVPSILHPGTVPNLHPGQSSMLQPGTSSVQHPGTFSPDFSGTLSPDFPGTTDITSTSDDISVDMTFSIASLSPRSDATTTTTASGYFSQDSMAGPSNVSRITSNFRPGIRIKQETPSTSTLHPSTPGSNQIKIQHMAETLHSISNTLGIPAHAITSTLTQSVAGRRLNSPLLSCPDASLQARVKVERVEEPIIGGANQSWTNPSTSMTPRLGRIATSAGNIVAAARRQPDEILVVDLTEDDDDVIVEGQYTPIDKLVKEAGKGFQAFFALLAHATTQQCTAMNESRQVRRDYEYLLRELHQIKQRLDSGQHFTNGNC